MDVHPPYIQPGYLLYALLIFWGLHHVLAVAVSTVFGILFGFKAFSALVFNNHNNYLIFRYLLVWALVYCLNVAGIAVLNVSGLNDYLAGFLMLIPLAGLGFLLNKTFVFRKASRAASGLD